jgi:hypothetical protein
VFRESFPAALELFELRAMATGRGEDVAREWRALFDRMQKARATFEAETGLMTPAPAAETAPGPPRRRRGGRRHRRP